MDIQKTVNAKLEEMISSGSIESMIENQLQSCIKDSLEDAMRSYGDFGKAIKEKLKESLGNSLDRIEFPTYNDVMAKAAHETYTNIVNEEAAKAITAVFKDELKPVPDEITFDELSDQIKDFWGEHCEYDCDIELEWDTSRENTIEIVFKHPKYDFESVKVTLYNHRSDKGYNIGYVDQEGNKSDRASSATRLFTGLEGYLFKLYSNRTIFTDILDNEDENIYVSGY